MHASLGEGMALLRAWSDPAIGWGRAKAPKDLEKTRPHPVQIPPRRSPIGPRHHAQSDLRSAGGPREAPHARASPALRTLELQAPPPQRPYMARSAQPHGGAAASREGPNSAPPNPHFPHSLGADDEGQEKDGEVGAHAGGCTGTKGAGGMGTGRHAKEKRTPGLTQHISADRPHPPHDPLAAAIELQGMITSCWWRGEARWS